MLQVDIKTFNPFQDYHDSFFLSYSFNFGESSDILHTIHLIYIR